MAKHHASAAAHSASGRKHQERRTLHTSTPSRLPKRPRTERNVKVFPLRPVAFSEAGARNLPALLSWPFEAMDMMLGSMADWMDNFHPIGYDRLTDIERTETEKAYVLKMPLPGVRSEQVRLAIAGNMLELHVKASGEKEEKGRYLRSSRYLSRAVPLPVAIDGEAIKAELKEGILTIMLPKSDRPVMPKIGSIELR